MRISQICLYLFFSVNYLAQSIKLSRSEFCWAAAHPFAALKIKKISKELTPVYEAHKNSQQLDSWGSGGNSDAYRHAFYMAAFAQKVKVRKLRRLGRAHEKANYRNFLRSGVEDGERADSLACVMDLHNNELGFTAGSSHKDVSLEALSSLIIDNLWNGKGRIMKRNRRGEYVTCDGRPLQMPVYAKQWAVPKCLVPSGSAYVD